MYIYIYIYIYIYKAYLKAPHLRTTCHFYSKEPDSGKNLYVTADHFYLNILAETCIVHFTCLQVYCLLWYYNVSHPVVAAVEELKTGRGLSVGDSHYEEKLFTCVLPTWHVPEHVSLTLGSECNPAYALVPVLIPQRARMHDFGVCVAVAYGSINGTRIKEWVEFHRLLGVGEFNIYHGKLDRMTLDVFTAYSKQHVVALRQIAPPIDNWCTWCQKLATIAVLNDCMYRNMHRYKYMVVVDFDEIIVPHSDVNYSEMLQRITRASQSTSVDQFAFRNAYFFLDFPADETQPRELVTLRYHTRAAVSQPGVAVKSILNPRGCVSMQNHYCAKRMPRDATVLMVDPDVALNHHYKRCHLTADECGYTLRHGVDDGATQRFREQLLDNLAKQRGITPR